MLIMRFQILCVLIAGFVVACGPESQRVNVIFQDAEGLQRGHKVIYHGVAIGVVQNVELLPDDRVRVALRVDGEHRERVREGVRFDIKKPSIMTISSERIVDMEVPDLAKPTLPDGATVEGYAGMWDEMLDDLKELGEKVGAEAAEQALELLEEARTMLADSVTAVDTPRP